MRLYFFEHCSLCFRVRMTAALKKLQLQETVVLDDDTDTLLKLVGKRQIPILVKDDSQPMLESMDMVKHIDRIGEPILTGLERPEVAAWSDATAKQTARLTWPRYPLLGLPEFATAAAHDHYIMRKRKALGHQSHVMAKSMQLPGDVMSAAADFHTDQTAWNIGKPVLKLRPRDLQPKNNCAALIEADQVECVFTDIDADSGNSGSR